MLYVENIEINGKQFVRTYSDQFKIERDGVVYVEAVDPLNMDRKYTETDIPLPKREEEKAEAINKAE